MNSGGASLFESLNARCQRKERGSRRRPPRRHGWTAGMRGSMATCQLSLRPRNSFSTLVQFAAAASSSLRSRFSRASALRHAVGSISRSSSLRIRSAMTVGLSASSSQHSEVPNCLSREPRVGLFGEVGRRVVLPHLIQVERDTTHLNFSSCVQRQAFADVARQFHAQPENGRRRWCCRKWR
jgi:hypothetical protein